MKNDKILADKYLPVEIGGMVKVVQSYFKLKTVNNNKKLVGVISLKLSCKVEVDNVKLDTQYFEKSFEISQEQLNKLLPEYVQKAFLEDRVFGFMS